MSKQLSNHPIVLVIGDDRNLAERLAAIPNAEGPCQGQSVTCESDAVLLLGTLHASGVPIRLVIVLHPWMRYHANSPRDDDRTHGAGGRLMKLARKHFPNVQILCGHFGEEGFPELITKSGGTPIHTHGLEIAMRKALKIYHPLSA